MLSPPWWTVLDPSDWEAFRSAAHRALDDAIDSLRDVRDEPVWQQVPDEIKARLREPMPDRPRAFEDVYGEYRETIAPYVTGNIHPRFWGWVHGSGTPGGAIADMLAAFMNSNVGGRDHGAVYVERQVIGWFRDLFGMPADASGLLVSGSSAANFIAVLAARTRAQENVRATGVHQHDAPLVGYASAATHACVRKAFENAGLGSAALRVLPVDANHRMDVDALRTTIESDRSTGNRPFLIVGNAGTVDVGAIDPLKELAEIAQREQIWLHVDGAFGAPAYLSQTLRGKLAGIESADSIAFDFHKWLHVPYDAGCVLVRDGAVHRATFASEGPYITRMPRGLAAGEPWFTDYGPELSRGFRALKVWFTLKEHGSQKLAHAIERNCEQARMFASLVDAHPLFERVAPVELQIVVFRPVLPGISPVEIDTIVDEAAIRVQESGEAVLSSTTVEGRRALRVCITNHRTQDADLQRLPALLEAVIGEMRSTRAG